MGKLQEKFNSQASGDFVLSPGEYEGPLNINRSCAIEGNGATLWADKGPVLIISAPDVTIKNLRIEVTGSYDDKEASAAVKAVCPGVCFDGTEVNGNVLGIYGEPEQLKLPSVISLGEFAADSENTFSVKLNTPVSASLDINVKGLRLFPKQLTAGENTIALTTDKLRSNTILYGEILFKTAVIRRIYLSGKALANAAARNEASPVSSRPAASSPSQIKPPSMIIAPKQESPDIYYPQKGQRISMEKFSSEQVKVVYEHKGAKAAVDIDSYCFLLQDNGRVYCDDDLIFFGNTEAKDQSVKTVSADGKPLVIIEPQKTSSSVSKIVVCYSIYGDDAGQNFSLITQPSVRIFDGSRELYRFNMDGLSAEKTVVAVEIYRYKGEWKLGFVGCGYRNGLKQLCESYGVNVE